MPERERSDDELARTATAPGSAKAPAASALGDSLGRYRLERELGAGGMGVVHAAFDPDLERRVALKVLRTSDAGGEARQRLLREARALARVTHANVVTVHEVGSANGRDFVAMELIDGETLADWLKSGRRTTHDILAAFIAAGRGLAAAHAAGLVHRDFKPHNVLRRKDGRIVVTDFGLARGVDVATELAATVELKAGRPAETTPSSLSGLTQTGSVLGTPAYMAPEQWSGGPIGPSADQFAFCVALWEALAGERPYRGATIDALRLAIERGPDGLDASKLPRRVRAPLLRGLDPDPERRWPSMDALLAALVPAERRPRLIARTIAVALVAAGALIVSSRLTGHRPAAVAPTCVAPVLDPTTIWSPAIANDVRDKASPDIMRVLDGDIAKWTKLRQAACAQPPGIAVRRLGCLDGVLARFDAVRKASVRPPKAELDDITEELVDPAVCLVADPPRLPTKLSDAVVTGLAMAHHVEPEVTFDTKAAKAALETAGNDPCGRAAVLNARAKNEESGTRETAEEAVQAADVCGDDRARADALITQLSAVATAFTDPATPKILAAAEAAVQKVSEPDLLARLELTKADIASAVGNFDDQLAHVDRALRLLTERRPRGRLRAAMARVSALGERRKPGDLEAVRREAPRAKEIAVRMQMPRAVTTIESMDCMAQWVLGDVEGAHVRFGELAKRFEAERTKPWPGTETIDGVVVDTAGKPVPGATVAADLVIVVDSLGLFPTRLIRFTTTDEAGHFTLDHVKPAAIIVALHGRLRSHVKRAKQHDRLVLEPTTTIAGKVIDRVPDQYAVFAMSGERGASAMYQMMTPIRADGSFTLEGVPIGKLRVLAVSGTTIMNQSLAMQEVSVGPGGLANIEVRHAPGRKLRVVVRSSAAIPLSGAEVTVVAGTVSIKTADELEQVLKAPGVAIATARPPVGDSSPELKLLSGDVVATLDHAPAGVATACAIGLSGDLTDPKYGEKLEKHRKEIAVRCVPLAADQNVVTIEVPPLKRFD